VIFGTCAGPAAGPARAYYARLTASSPYSRVAVAGTGTIGCGLAASASAVGDVVVLARAAESAERAEGRVTELCAKLDPADRGRISFATDAGELAGCDLAVEAIVEDPAAKAGVLTDLAIACPDADLASTTSSLSVADLAVASGRPDRFFAFHVFNPVHRMELVEVCFPTATAEPIRRRALGWCEALGKTAVEVPDQAGFVVNRLLFPYLFDAVRLLETTTSDSESIDACMTLGAGYPMGPLALLDMVGLDVAVAIGQAIHAETGEHRDLPPDRLEAMVGRGELGKKSGRGFYEYD
jgi:3-hydroxybutyryl-CoA dehydrogenase